MSGREWRPGDVAMVANLHGDTPRLARRGVTASGSPCWWFLDTQTWTNGAEVRPLVVIDPEDREQIERLVHLWTAAEVGDGLSFADALQAALREFANPTPPKPDEPMAEWAVIEDAEGDQWIRDDPQDRRCAWRRRGDGCWRSYQSIAAVRVIREGVVER